MCSSSFLFLVPGEGYGYCNSHFCVLSVMHLFVPPLGVIGRLFSGIVATSGHLQYFFSLSHSVYIFCFASFHLQYWAQLFITNDVVS